MKKVSSTNTKNEILEAYEEVLQYLNDQKSENSLLKKELSDKGRSVVGAKEITAVDNPTEAIENLRKAVNKQIDELQNKVLEEKSKFEKIEEAIQIEKDTLENLYKIRVEAESLEALIITNKRAKENLDDEIKATNDLHEAQVKQAKLERKREDDEYNYNLKIKRRDEEDAYIQKKAKQEQELKTKKEEFDKMVASREESLQIKEDELLELRQKALEYDNNLRSAVAATEKEVSNRLKKEYEFQQKLENKDLEVQIKLFQQEVEALKLKVKEQQLIVSELNEKSAKASDQVKDIALKAIEGASTSRWTNEKNREEKKE